MFKQTLKEKDGPTVIERKQGKISQEFRLARGNYLEFNVTEGTLVKLTRISSHNFRLELGPLPQSSKILMPGDPDYAGTIISGTGRR